MLPRSVLFIIMVSCWFQISASPFHPRDDYQELREDGDVMDYAFPDDESSQEDTSIFDTINNTVDTLNTLDLLHNKSNINLNANNPKNKKSGKKSHGQKHKNRHRHRKGHKQKSRNHNANNGTIPLKNNTKDDDSDIKRRSAQHIFEEIAKDAEIVTEKQLKLSKTKPQNYCANSRRSNLDNYSQIINMNSSYLDIDEDFTLDGHEEVKKTHTIFTDDYITLCWIETTTIKDDTSYDPPKRLILREATISFENSAVIPEEYLSCPIIEGDITREPNEILCNTSFIEAIHDDTLISKTINITKFSRENNIDVHTNKLIKCAMGSVITKDVYEWINETNSTRQRVEIKVSPQTYKTEEICPYYSTVKNDDLQNNETSECSDESELDEDEKGSSENITKCLGDNCPGGQINQSVTVSTISPELNVLLTKKPSSSSEINDELSTGFTKTSSATETPKLQSPIEKDIRPPVQSPIVDETSDETPEKNITDSSESESCENSDCDSSYSSIENISDEIVKTNESDNITQINVTTNLADKDKTKSPFKCPVEDKKVCAHLERVAKLQSAEHSSDENLAESHEKLTLMNETSSSKEDTYKEDKEIDTGNIVTTLISSPTQLPNNRRSTIPSLKLPSAQNTEITTQSTILKTIDGLNGDESEQNLSSENSAELNSETNLEVNAESSNKDKSVESSSIKNSGIYINFTQKFEELSASQESNFISNESMENVLAHDIELNESCDGSENCHQPNSSTYTPRISSPSAKPPITVTPINQEQVEEKTERAEEDSGSCDCDEDSNESKKCDSKLGPCSSESHLKQDDKLSTQSMRVDDNDPTKTHELESITVPINEEITTLPTMTERETVNDKEDNKETTQNHKLSLKIHVSLEHIDENKENHELAQVEKHITLNELPDQHGNHSLYWQIQALNKSANDIDSLRDMFNCSILEQLTEEAIIEKLNVTNLESEISNSDDSYSRRKRRSVGNITQTIDGNNNNGSMNGSSVIKECIIPNIREDVKNGLTDMISELSSALNNSKNVVTEKPNINSTAITTTAIINNITTTESPRNSTVSSRKKRSLMNNNGDGIEEISRWSKERFTPSIYGGQLRSFTELKILQNS